MDDILALPFSIFCILAIILFGLSGQAQIVQEYRLDSMLSNEAEIIATNGVFSKDTYERIERQISLYGEYVVKIRLDKKVISENEEYEKFFDEDSILDEKLSVGDRVHIMIYQTNSTALERLAKSKIFFENTKEYDFKNYKYITIPIVKDGE